MGRPGCSYSSEECLAVSLERQDSTVKKVIKKLLRSVDLDIRRLSKVRIPFGVDWMHDIGFFCRGKQLGIIFDVGANIGDVTRRLTEFFPDSDIFAFEPVPGTYKTLVENTRDLRRVTATQAGMSNRAGQGVITAIPHSGLNTLLLDDRDKDSEPEKPTATVGLLTVDEFCNDRGIDRIGLLKTDTEGHDIHVLQGAQNLLENGRIEFILSECAFPGAGEDSVHSIFGDIEDLLVPFGYHVVSFYTCAVNELGWIWGDVLFRCADGLEPGPVVPLQPYRRKLWSE
jgi:FkbM family methyltransferase